MDRIAVSSKDAALLLKRQPTSAEMRASCPIAPIPSTFDECFPQRFLEHDIAYPDADRGLRDADKFRDLLDRASLDATKMACSDLRSRFHIRQQSSLCVGRKAGGRARTGDLWVGNPLLHQLSYARAQLA